MWGDDDRVLHPSALDILRPLMPAAEFILMRDMGHVPMIDQPALLLAALGGFLLDSKARA